MLDKLQGLEDKYLDLESRISDPDVIADQNKWQSLTKMHARLGDVVESFRQYKQLLQHIADAKEMQEISDEPEMLDMIKAELAELTPQVEPLEHRLRILLLPKDPNDEKNIIMEIRGGAGGDEAALFAGVLFRMYTRYAESRGWRVEVLDSNPTGLGGMKEVVFMITGFGVYSVLKYESGVHRVQRVPETESSGRIHTSTATVLVIPEAEDVKIDIKDTDLRVDVCRSSGAGGQCVNTTDSAVRVTHLPTGIMVYCQVERSQIRNKERALQILQMKLQDKAEQEEAEKIGAERRSKIGTGSRSEKIRTYNYPQNRITDHRINYTSMNLDRVMLGNLDEIIEALITEDERMKLESENEE